MPTHPLVAATTLIVVPGGAQGAEEAVWRKQSSPMTIEKSRIERVSDGCWRQAAMEWDGCRGAIDICGAICGGGDPVEQDCVTATVTWTNVVSGGSQTWTFTGVQ